MRGCLRFGAWNGALCNRRRAYSLQDVLQRLVLSSNAAPFGFKGATNCQAPWEAGHAVLPTAMQLGIIRELKRLGMYCGFKGTA